MEKININDIKTYTKGNIIKNNNQNPITKVSIDSREINEETLFVPIIGAKFDGHTFMESAYEKGCRNFIEDKNHDFQKEDINIVKVDDTTKAFGQIAKGYKEKFNIPIIAVTGSVGKTSTKDIITSVLKTKYNVTKTQGNHNNEIGLPKTLLTITKKTELAVIEMGMDKKGEIDYLTNLVNPNIGIITNIGMSHIMNFENQEGIFNAKMEIINGFKDNGLLIVNGDDKYLKTLKKQKHNYELLTYGFNKENDIYCKKYTINETTSNFTCIYQEKEYNFTISSIAKHNIGNALIAIILGLKYKLTPEQIQKGLLEIELSQNRLDIIKTDKYTIINDTYNSSYDSVMSALEVLNNFKTRKVAILGDILELGKYSTQIHKKIGKNINCDVLIAIGNEAKWIYEEANKNIESYYFLTKEEFYDKMNAVLKDKDTILVKASRGMELDKVVEQIRLNSRGN